MQKWIAAVLTTAVALTVLFALPSVSYTEDKGAVELARVLYALARNDGYDTKLALGTVVMNRVEDPWFSSTLDGVLSEQQQFPMGERYDADSLRAAHEVLSGKRTLNRGVLYFQAGDAVSPWGSEGLISEVGGYRFYSIGGNLI